MESIEIFVDGELIKLPKICCGVKINVYSRGNEKSNGYFDGGSCREHMVTFDRIKINFGANGKLYRNGKKVLCEYCLK